MNSLKTKLVLALHKIGAVKFGSFKLKSGLTSPFYIDLRLIVSYPEIVDMIVSLLAKKIKELKYDCITGIPYTALPIASVLSTRLNVPLIYQRKEPKAYGTALNIEGVFEKGNTCLVIDDVMTTGESKIEIADAFKEAGLFIRDFVIVVDRSFNGQRFLKQYGYNLHALLTISEMVKILLEASLITENNKKAVEAFMQTDISDPAGHFTKIKEVTKNLLTARLIKIIMEKESNLVVSLDVEHQEEFFRILEDVAEHIVMVKTHVDILNDFNEQFVRRLKELASKKKFMIFEDRKFADIGNTVRKQFREGIYQIAGWADFVTVHSLPGEGILTGLFDGLKGSCSAFLLAAMSAKGNLISDTYSRTTIQMGANNRQWVSGFIGFAKTVDELKRLKTKIPADMLLLMPGVNLESGGDAMGQQYVTVKSAVNGGADLIIVGRGIIGADNPKAKAALYRREAWQALKNNGRV